MFRLSNRLLAIPVLCTALCAPAFAQTTPVPAPVTTPVVQPTATTIPSAGPSVSPGPSPAPSPSPSPYGYVVDPPVDVAAAPDAPRIVRIELNDRVLHPGGQLALRVTTTANVAKVSAATSGQTIEVQRAADGLFAGLTTIPNGIPFWLYRTYQVTFTAQGADGRKATATIPITLAR